MCRWLAYSGDAIPMSDLLTNPEHSMIDQSRHALQNIEPTNGDGFGIGWYGSGALPGVYHSTHPAWNDANIHSVAAYIRSALFLSHVRAATGTSVQTSNCHPFTFENWLFQHNGSIPEFSRIKRQLQFDVDPELFPHIAGSTDSETLFFLALGFGLRDDAPTALARTIGHVERARQAAGIELPIYFSACVTNGESIWAVRYSSHQQSRSLYHSRHQHALRQLHDSYEPLPEGSVIVVSEPLDFLSDDWEEMPESSLLTVAKGETTISGFIPQ